MSGYCLGYALFNIVQNVHAGGQQYRISRGSLQHPVSACKLLDKDPRPHFHSTPKLYGVNKGKRLK